MPEPSANELEVVSKGELIKDNGTLGEVGQAIADALPPSAVSDSTPYTLGPAAGAYDIEWADAENATPDATNPARFVLRDGQVFLLGWINFSGANQALNFTVPAALRPSYEAYFTIHSYDDSAGADVVVEVDIKPNGDVVIATMDGTAFANADIVFLAHSYLLLT